MVGYGYGLNDLLNLDWGLFLKFLDAFSKIDKPEPWIKIGLTPEQEEEEKYNKIINALGLPVKVLKKKKENDG